MKKLTRFIIFAVCLNSFSQNPKIEHENFKLQEDKKIKWQKVYEIEASKDSIKKRLDILISSSSFLNNLVYNNSTFVGLSNYTKISDLKGMPLAVHTDFNCFIKIDIKENRYRVTIKDIKFKPINMDYGMIEMNTNFVLEDVVVRSNYHEIRKNKTARKVLLNLNKDFLKLLTLKDLTNDDW